MAFLLFMTTYHVCLLELKIFVKRSVMKKKAEKYRVSV